jgi:ABC-type sugar transport system permease subunit
MTGGGPGYDTSVLAILLYRFAYNSGDMGRGYAVGVVLLAITLVFVALFIREFERTRGEA